MRAFELDNGSFRAQPPQRSREFLGLPFHVVLALSIVVSVAGGVLLGTRIRGQVTHTPIPTPPAEVSSGRKRVLTILLDGLRPDVLLAHAPTLRELSMQGVFSFHVDCGPVPLSGPSWATILTGTRMSKHLFLTNDVRQIHRDDKNGALSIHPEKCACQPTIGGKPNSACKLYEAAFEKGEDGPMKLPESMFAKLAHSKKDMRSSFIVQGWAGIGVLAGGTCMDKSCLLESAHVAHSKAIDGQHDLPDATSETLLDGRFQHRFFSDLEAAAKQAEDTIASAEGPDLVAVFIDDIDGAGHKFGFGLDVQEYIDKVKEVDAVVLRLLRAMNMQREKWLVAVTTDHGGSTAQMPKDMREDFDKDACLNNGISQKTYTGIHGIAELPEHRQTFQIFAYAPDLAPGELIPAPEPTDIVPTILNYLTGEIPDGLELDGKVIDLSAKSRWPAARVAREKAEAEKALATKVAKAIGAVEAELKKTWGKPEAERKDNLRRLWRLWHPDKREDRLLTSVLLATEVMKYLNGCRDQYLQERADGIAGQCRR